MVQLGTASAENLVLLLVRILRERPFKGVGHPCSFLEAYICSAEMAGWKFNVVNGEKVSSFSGAWRGTNRLETCGGASSGVLSTAQVAKVG